MNTAQDEMAYQALEKMWHKVVALTHAEHYRFTIPSKALMEDLRLQAAYFHGATMVLISGPERHLASTLWYLTTMAAIDVDTMLKAQD